MKADRSVLAGIACVCFANLLLEVLVTRILSATMFYHFTFVAVGLAMFGIAAGGVYVFVNERRLGPDVRGSMARAARRFAFTAVLALIYTVKIRIFPYRMVPDFTVRVLVEMALLVFVTALPFFFAGVVVALALTAFSDDVERVYAFDLIGAALAAILCGTIVAWLGGPTAVLVAAAAGLTGAALLGRGRWRWAWPALGAGLVGLNVASNLLHIGAVKGDSETVFERWNVFSRVTVDRSGMIRIDSTAATPINDLRRLTPDLYKSRVEALALSTFDAPPGPVLIIGPGGGQDVLFALSRGAGHVTGVDINPIIAQTVMQERFFDATGGLYRDPRVSIVIDDGRSFVRRSAARYDLIQASLVDTWAATGAGAFALSENTLYTVEAFRDYFEHLSDRGVVTMTRFWWGADERRAGYSPNSMAETPRLAILAAAALEQLGVPATQTRRHIFFAGATGVPFGTLVAKRTPFTPDELARLESAAHAARFTILASPAGDGTSALERYLDAGAWSDLVRGAKWDLSPPTDDRPFFFYYTRLSDLLHPSIRFYDPALWLLIMIGAMVLLAAGFIAAPLLLRLSREGVPSADEPGRLQMTVLTCFGLLGFSFMAIEIAFLQRFSLFLGHPSYALLAILSVVLLSTAAGAWASRRYAVERLPRVLLVAGVATALVSVVYGAVLGDLIRLLIGWPLVARLAITSALIAPCGLLMGPMLPGVVRVLGAAGSPLVPWGWGINGATSVVGTALATIVAMHAGFAATFYVGALGYAAAGALGARAASDYAALCRGRSRPADVEVSRVRVSAPVR